MKSQKKKIKLRSIRNNGCLENKKGKMKCKEVIPSRKCRRKNSEK